MKTILMLLATALCAWASEFPVPYNSEPDPGTPLPAPEAAAKMKLPLGFKATVFASEPDVQNPIAMAWDGRGRLWVAENYTYAERKLKFDLSLRDRLLIFEDTDGDGHFDSRKVFTDELQMLTSVAVGLGGVWVMCPPRLLFIPDHNLDDLPDSAPEVILDGFTVPTENYHNFANGLRFGPDGWLYGRCGASSPGEIGKPGAPSDQRIPMRGTIWRYHPQRKIFEALSSGTTNPWGHDWDANGELFFINTVNGQLWHDITGAHYVRPHTIDPNPRVYGLIDQHADHLHFDTAQGWTQSRDGVADSFGGGHAHAGMMIYLGDNWPSTYRGNLFTLNLHGRRANQEILERTGSGYVGHHGQDLLFSADPWFRGMELSYGPDGGVYVLDWSDTGECHESTGVHRTSGRIFKVTYGDPKPTLKVNLDEAGDNALIELQANANEWFSRYARLELENRFGNNAPRTTPAREAVAKRLGAMFASSTNAATRLRALWSLNAIGSATSEFLQTALSDPEEHVRVWAIRLLTDSWPLDTVLSQRPFQGPGAPSIPPSLRDLLVHVAKTDKSGLVRLALASTLQRLPTTDRLPLAVALVKHSEDATDHNLPLMIWYGLIPVADANPSSLVPLAAECELPLTLKYIVRRLTEDIENNPNPLNSLLDLRQTKSSDFSRQVVDGMSEALTGWRKAPKPPAWSAFVERFSRSDVTALNAKVRNLEVLFGDGRALEEVRKVVLDQTLDAGLRKSALQTLIDARAPGLRELCEQMLNVQFVNSVAARGLSSFSDPAAGAKLVKAFRQFHPSERPQLLSTLVSRAPFASALLDAIGEGRVPRSELTAFHARQIRTLNDPAVTQKLTEVWGELRVSPQQNQQAIVKWKSQFTPANLAAANLSQGRATFSLSCGPCHTLYGEGGKVGPDLTGSSRDNLDYLLENIVDPSAVVNADFRMSVVKTRDGRVLNGIIAAKTERTITLKTMTETISIERTEVESAERSSISLMPEGLLDSLGKTLARDLIGYLMHETQVPLPRGDKTARNPND